MSHRRSRFAAAALLMAALSSCGDSGGSSSADPPRTSAAQTSVAPPPSAATAPAGTAPAGSAAQTAAPLAGAGETVAPNVSSRIIDTPDAILDVAPPGYTQTPKDFSIVAEASVPNVAVYPKWDDTAPFTTVGNPLPSGSPLTFLVIGQTPTRAKVLVPINPPKGSSSNEVEGWIELAQVATKRNDYRIEIELSKHELTVFRGATGVLMTVPVGVGTNATPTPGGRYYIKELIKPINPRTKTYDPNGVYGPYAYGLSGYSQIYDEDNPFNGGDGQLGIHGTNQPELIGTDVSAGCIRMSNEDIVKLRELLPLGTPVIVKE